MSSLTKISIILPTYNERYNIIPLTQTIGEVLKGREYEVLVVDDNSPDGTYQAVVDLRDPRVKAILRVQDRGLAFSIRCGLENATGNIFVIMDSDFNHQPQYLPFMIDALTYYDCVSGSRFVYGGRMDSRARHLMSWVFNIFNRLVTGGQVTDSLYGFIAIKREIMESCDYNNIFWGYGDYCIRLMYYLQRQNRSILQFPAVNGRRLSGTRNDRMLPVFLQYTKEVLSLSLRKRLRPNHDHDTR